MMEWVFEIGSTPIRLSTKATTYGGNTYAAAIVPASFSGVTMRWDISGSGLIAPSDLQFEVAGSYTASQFQDESCIVRQIIDGTQNRAWKFTIQAAIAAYGAVQCYGTHFLTEYLDGDWPNTPAPKEVWPSDDDDPENADDYCIPVTLGQAYIPVRSVNTGTARHYVLGADGTYTIAKVKSPRRWGSETIWLASEYTMTQSTDSGYRLLQPIIDDQDDDGTADAVGLWPDGTGWMDMLCLFTNSGTASTTNPADWIEYILESFGVPSADIDSTTFGTAATAYTSDGITFNGGFWKKENRERILANLLQQVDSYLVLEDEIKLYRFDKSSTETVTNVALESYRPTRITKPASDSIRVHWPKGPNTPQDLLLGQTIVSTSVAGTTNTPSSTILKCRFLAGQSENAQTAGILYAQKQLAQQYRADLVIPVSELSTKATISPGKVITVNNTLYGGSNAVIVTDITFTREGDARITVVKLSTMSEWSDLLPTAVSVTEDSSSGFEVPTTAGADGINTATIYLYQRATSEPATTDIADPVTWTFATASLSGSTGAWSTSVPSGTNTLWLTAATAAANTATDDIAQAEWSTPVTFASSGFSHATVFLYKRAASSPAVPSTTATYTFSTAVLTGHNNGWTQTVPSSDGNPLWVTSAVATATAPTDTDTIATGEWATPGKMAEDGADGSDGAPGADGADGAPGSDGTDGLNSATVFLYRRYATTPTLPSTTSTYTFSTGVLTGHNNSWTQGVPTTDGNPLWVTTAAAISSSSTDTISSGEWATPTKLAEDGSDGSDGSDGAPGADGSDGYNTATIYLYQRKSTVPGVTDIADPVTYTFSTTGISGTIGAWSRTVPSGTDPLYVTAATATSTGATDTIARSEWASVVKMAEDGSDGSDGAPGADGSDGADGLNSATVFLYKRAASSPAVPSTTATYTFSTAVLTGHNNGWTQAVPATDGNPLYVTSAVAVSTSTTDTILTGEWATPAVMAQDGADGSAGTDARTVDLTSDTLAFAYDAAGANPSPASATLTATAHNASGTVYYRFLINDVQAQHTTTNTYTYTPDAAYANMPETAKVEIREGGTGEAVKATDTISLVGIKPGSDGSDGSDGAAGADGADGTDAVTILVTNEAHTLPTTNTGTVTYSGSGTDIRVWRGITALAYGTGNSQFSVSAVGTSITVGAASTVSTYTRRFADHSAMTANNASIEYTITVKDADGTPTVFTRFQSFSKSIQGDDGADGANGADGADGDVGPGLVYRGAFVAGSTYYYTGTRRDVVEYSGTYYIYNVPTSASGNTESSWTAGDWEVFASSFESVATKLLLAEDAAITKNLHVGGGTGDNTAGMSGDGSLSTSIRIWAGSATKTSAPFRVTQAGSVTMTDVTVTAGDVTIDNDGITVGGSGGIVVAEDASIAFESNSATRFHLKPSYSGSINSISLFPTTDDSDRFYIGTGTYSFNLAQIYATTLDIWTGTDFYKFYDGNWDFPGLEFEDSTIAGSGVNTFYVDGHLKPQGASYESGSITNPWNKVYANSIIFDTTNLDELDDYQEGTYEEDTVESYYLLIPATGTITLNTSYNTLSYTKIGRHVTVNGRIKVGASGLSTSPAPSGTLQLKLPYEIGALAEWSEEFVGQVLPGAIDALTVAGTLSLYGASGTTAYIIIETTTGSTESAIAEYVNNDSIFYFNFTYFAAT